MKGFGRILVISIMLIFPCASFGADIWVFTSRSGRLSSVIIEGAIEPGDFEIFENTVRDLEGAAADVHIFSPGGNFYEAMKIGRALRKLELTSVTPMRDASGKPSCETTVLGNTPVPKYAKNCINASAGFFVHVGGVHRSGTYLAVHRPYFERGAFSTLSQADANEEFSKLQATARGYMDEMGVPLHIQDTLMEIPSDDILILDDSTVRSFFLGPLAYLEEWRKSKCSKMTNSENIRMDGYAELLRNAGKYNVGNINSYSDMGFTDSSWQDLQRLRKIQFEEISCEADLIKQARNEAFKRYFQ